MSEETPPLTVAAIFVQHAPYVWRVLRRLGVADCDVEDVCQEVFVVVHRRLEDFEGRSQLRTWIYGICLRCAAAYRRRAHRQHEVRGTDEPASGNETTHVAALDQRRALRLLDRVLDQLPTVQREVYVLFELEQLAMQEVAQAVGCPLQTAYSRLHSARRRIAEALSVLNDQRSVS